MNYVLEAVQYTTLDVLNKYGEMPPKVLTQRVYKRLTGEDLPRTKRYRHQEVMLFGVPLRSVRWAIGKVHAAWRI